MRRVCSSPLKFICRSGSLLIVAAMFLQACGSDSGAGTPADHVSETTASSSATTAGSVLTGGSALPMPVAAWDLRGDGEASVGNVDLKASGGFEFTPAGVVFDGVTGKAITPGPGPLDTTDSLTISAWVSHPDQLVDVPMVVGQAGENQLSIGLGVGGEVWIFGTTDQDLPGSGGGGALISGPTAVRSNDWVHVAGVSDRDAGVIRFYLDGELLDETPASTPFPASGPLIIGGGLGAEWWAGAVVDVAIYQTALTSAEIAEIYRTTRPVAPPPVWSPNPVTYADGILNGTWDYPLSEATDPQILAELRSDYGKFDEARIRLGFDGSKYWQGVVVDGELVSIGGERLGDVGIIRIDGDQLTITGWGLITTYRWSLEGSALNLQLVEECDRQTGECFTRDDRAVADPMVLYIIEHTFTKSGDDPSY